MYEEPFRGPYFTMLAYSASIDLITTVAHRDKTLPQITKHLLGSKNTCTDRKPFHISQNTCTDRKHLHG